LTAPSGTLPESWRIQLPTFQGPLDLLLQLIKVNKVEISEIPVAVVCDQFHEYLGLMEELNLDIAAEYIYEAALLINLKSKMLLPKPRSIDGEELEDPREELVKRLIDYRKLKDASQSLAEIHSLRVGVWTRPPQKLPSIPDAEEPETLELEEVSLFDLLKALKDVLVRFDHEHPEPFHVMRETFSVREQFERILRELEAGKPFDLLADLRGRRSRGEIVAAFLAVLEAARMHLIRLHQAESGELVLYRTTRELQKHDLEAVQV
jgi:segregation and condensation protein A